MHSLRTLFPNGRSVSRANAIGNQISIQNSVLRVSQKAFQGSLSFPYIAFIWTATLCPWKLAKQLLHRTGKLKTISSQKPSTSFSKICLFFPRWLSRLEEAGERGKGGSVERQKMSLISQRCMVTRSCGFCFPSRQCASTMIHCSPEQPFHGQCHRT